MPTLVDILFYSILEIAAILKFEMAAIDALVKIADNSILVGEGLKMQNNPKN